MFRAALFVASLSRASAICADVRAYLASVNYSAVDTDRFRSGAAGPQQLKLSLTGNPSEMFITWVEAETAECAGSFATLRAAGGASTQFAAAASTYEAGVLGWQGTIYVAKMTGLTPGAAYTYTVTSCGVASAPAGFNAAPVPAPTVETLVAVLADMGTAVPLGFEVAAQLTRDNNKERFSMAMLSGDISYATVSPPKDEFEQVWDAYGEIIATFTNSTPFMPNVGNHGATLPRCATGRLLRTDALHPP
jgi:hypothetical protein